MQEYVEDGIMKIVFVSTMRISLLKTSTRINVIYVKLIESDVVILVIDMGSTKLNPCNFINFRLGELDPSQASWFILM